MLRRSPDISTQSLSFFAVLTALMGLAATRTDAAPPHAGPSRSSLSVANTYTKSQNVAAVSLADAATITTDASTSNIFTVTLAGNRTLANPMNLVAGGTYIWQVTQDNLGAHTLAYGTTFKWPGGTGPTLSTTANAVDMISCLYTTQLNCVAALNFH
jgi:hypothetical protein